MTSPGAGTAVRAGSPAPVKTGMVTELKGSKTNEEIQRANKYMLSNYEGNAKENNERPFFFHHTDKNKK